MRCTWSVSDMAGLDWRPTPISRARTPRSIPASLATPRLRRLFRQFSFPGGIPSHVAPETPGSIHEGGELGYALAHAYGGPRYPGGVLGRRGSLVPSLGGRSPVLGAD